MYEPLATTLAAHDFPLAAATEQPTVMASEGSAEATLLDVEQRPEPERVDPDAPPPTMVAARPNPRAAAVASLYEHAARLATMGALAGARELHAAIGRMLGVGVEEDGAPVVVVDLASRRERR